MNLETIVVGTSLRPESDAVVATGLSLARLAGARIRLVHAVRPFDVAFAFDTEQAEDTYRRRGKDELGRLEEQIRRLGFAAGDFDGWTVRVGSRHRVVLDVAREHGAHLIVLGARERCTEGLGGTAERVVRTSPYPVLLLRGRMPVPPRRAALLTDLSKPAGFAVRYGHRFLDRISAAACERRLLLVLRDEPHGGPFTADTLRRLGGEELVRQHPLDETAAPCDHLVRIGAVRATLRDELRAWSADLAVLGTQGISGHDRCLLGSVTTWLTREAPCAVLVVPPEAAGHARSGLEDQRRYRGDWAWVSNESRLSPP